MRDAASHPPVRLRLDQWLDVACLFKTRSEAQKACKGGKVEVNGQRAKPHREIATGDELGITRALGQRQRVIVRGLAARHLPRADARRLYDDVTPAPSPEQVEWLRAARLAGRSARRVGWRGAAAGKRAPRAIRRLKGRDA